MPRIEKKKTQYNNLIIGALNTYINFSSVNFNKIEYLNLVNAYYVTDIPEQFSNLKELYINNTPIKFLPKYLDQLEVLRIAGNDFIPEIPDNYTNIYKLIIFNANNIKEIPKTFTNLEKLIIGNCKYLNEDMAEYFKISFPNLKTLKIDEKIFLSNDD